MFNVINIFQLIWVSGIYTSKCTCVLVFVGTNQPFIMWVGIKDRPSLSKERACPGSLQLQQTCRKVTYIISYCGEEEGFQITAY